MTDYVHGGTDAREIARLEKQARWTASFLLPALPARPGERVLDLATGVGAMAEQIRLRFPDVRLVGVDLRMSQLRSAARHHPGIRWVNGDGSRLPFRDGAFDRVHCSWLLEHVRHPVAVLRDVRRVLRPGGTATFAEVDNASFRVVPADPQIQSVMDALNRAQIAAGGDPFAGQKLDRLFREAGFAQVKVSPVAHRGTGANPEAYRALVEEFAEIFEGLDEALGPDGTARAQEAARRLRALPGRPGTEMHYTGALAVAVA